MSIFHEITSTMMKNEEEKNCHMNDISKPCVLNFWDKNVVKKLISNTDYWCLKKKCMFIKQY